MAETRETDDQQNGKKSSVDDHLLLLVCESKVRECMPFI